MKRGWLKVIKNRKDLDIACINFCGSQQTGWTEMEQRPLHKFCYHLLSRNTSAAQWFWRVCEKKHWAENQELLSPVLASWARNSRIWTLRITWSFWLDHCMNQQVTGFWVSITEGYMDFRYMVCVYTYTWNTSSPHIHSFLSKICLSNSLENRESFQEVKHVSLKNPRPLGREGGNLFLSQNFYLGFMPNSLSSCTKKIFIS